MADDTIRDRTDRTGAHEGPVTLVNIFMPTDGRLEAFVAAQTGEYERMQGRVEGWLGNHLHVALDGRDAVNIARFASLEAYNAFRGSDLFADHLERIRPFV